MLKQDAQVGLWGVEQDSSDGSRNRAVPSWQITGMFPDAVFLYKLRYCLYLECATNVMFLH